jgi:hypothetical protein
VTDETLLLRQIHPNFIQTDKVSSQAFCPTPKDQAKLSVYDGDMITPENSWKHYTERGLESGGVLAVTVHECKTESLGAYSSPQIFPEHAHIDFAGLTGSATKGKAKRLRQFALGRGWRHRPQVRR